MRRLILVVGSSLLLASLFSCATGEPVEHTANGRTYVYIPKSICGIRYTTDVKEIKTPEQAKADLEVKALEDQQRVEARRASIALWLGGLLLICSVACSIIAYLTKGWKRWGGLSVLCLSACAFCWGFIEWIEYLKWLAIVLPAVAVGLFLYENKDFDVKEWLDKRKMDNGS